MKKLTSIIIFLMTLGSLDAERVYGNDPPKGKVYVYKEVDGMTREMEIFFRKIMTHPRSPSRESLCFMVAVGVAAPA